MDFETEARAQQQQQQRALGVHTYIFNVKKVFFLKNKKRLKMHTRAVLSPILPVFRPKPYTQEKKHSETRNKTKLLVLVENWLNVCASSNSGTATRRDENRKKNKN